MIIQRFARYFSVAFAGAYLFKMMEAKSDNEYWVSLGCALLLIGWATFLDYMAKTDKENAQ